MSLPDFKYLQINGPVSVLPVTGKVPWDSYNYLIMGPTGAGKSSFIEALAGNAHGLQISGNQLASVTQSVTAYWLVNVTRAELPVYIIDTPGFSDAKISEGEIVGMVEKWREDNDDVRIDNIFFLTPITATRIEGSKRRTLKMMKALLGEARLGSTIFVTTMWDQVANERAQERAESNFTQLENDVLKDWICKGAQLTRFKNDQSSALEALDTSYLYRFIYFYSRPSLLYHDLHERISTALQEKQMTEEQLSNPTNNDTLNALLKKNQADNEDLLVKFIGQLQSYKKPPEGYEDQHAHLSAGIVELGDELERMEVRARERELALGHQRARQILLLRGFQQRLQSELEVFSQRQEERKQRESERQERQRQLERDLQLEQERQRLVREQELERRRLVREQEEELERRRLGYRFRQKLHKATTSITSIFKPTSRVD